MPKTKFQKFVYTIIMVICMVYTMICYNIALNTGGLTNQVFVAALGELPIMGIIAFILEFFFIEKLAPKLAFRFVDQKKRQTNFCNISTVNNDSMSNVSDNEFFRQCVSWLCQPRKNNIKLVKSIYFEFSNGFVFTIILYWTFC